MKAEEGRTQSQSPRKHVLEHEVPTVIHDPEAEMYALAKWLRHAMEDPVKFWGGVTLLVVVVVGLSVLANGLPSRSDRANEAWSRLESAKTAAERVEIAKDFPNTPAERWALLQAAAEFYDKGFRDLPNHRDAALPSLKKALDLFEKVATDAPQDSLQARVAALGVARTHEARNELDKAVAQYEKIVKTSGWSGTDEAKTAERLAQELKKPEVVAFYEKLYKYETPSATLPAGGIGNIELPITPSPADSTKSESPAARSPETSPLILPPLPPENKPLPTPDAVPAKPKEEAKPASSGELPSDIFSPPAGSEPKK